MTKVFGSMAVSLDGFIAAKNGDLSWLNSSMKAGEDYGLEKTLKRTGAYIIGANTYKEMLKSGVPMGSSETLTYVVTHQKDLKPNKYTEIYQGDLKLLVKKIKAQIDKDIWVFGGGDLLTQFIELDLLDELGIAVMPVMLGDGVRLFGNLKDWKKLSLTDCKFFKSGIVLLNYTFPKSE